MLKSFPVTSSRIRNQSSTFHQNRLPFSLLLLIILALSLSSCVTLNDPEVSQDYRSDIVGTIDPGTAVGQSLISRRSLLNGITIWLSPLSGADNSTNNPTMIPIKVELFHAPTDNTAIFSTVVYVSSLAPNQPIFINLGDLKYPPGQRFYIELTSSSSLVQVLGRSEDAYPHGNLYINRLPVNADLAFSSSYDYNFETLTQDFYLVLKNIPLVLPLIFTLLLPGWLILDFSGLYKRFDRGEQVGMALGISLAAYPLLILWTSYAKLSWSREGMYLLIGILVLVFLLRYIFRLLSPGRRLKPNDDTQAKQDAFISAHKSNSRQFPAFYSFIALLVIFTSTLAVRLIMIRDLATPAWVDSVHHALITRQIMAHGALAYTYEPYLNISPTDYHPGFHSIAAVFTWLSGLQLSDSLLILGQVLNASVVFSVYLLARTLTRSSLVGLIAALITGLLSPMPAYYTSWGRYTELSGLIILPSAFALISHLDGYSRLTHKKWLIALGAITSAGLFMVHYRVFVFLVLLIFSFVTIYLIRKYRQVSVDIKTLMFSLAAIAVLAVFFASPWFFQSIKSTLLPNISGPTAVPVPFFQDFSWSYLTAAMGKQVLVLAGLGLILGVVRKDRLPLLLLLWTILLFLVANLGAFGLPGDGLISNSSVEIMLFIPISILGGYFLRQLTIHWMVTLPQKLLPFIAAIFIITIGVWGFFGARMLVSIINPATLLSRRADLPAMEWIKMNLPENETVVINPFNWGYGIYAGNDGGYWISPLTGRLTMPPPVLYGLGNDIVMVKQLVQGIISSGSDPVALHRFMLSNHLKTIFIGARGGVISPLKLIDSGLFSLLYYQEDVWIFSLKP